MRWPLVVLTTMTMLACSTADDTPQFQSTALAPSGSDDRSVVYAMRSAVQIRALGCRRVAVLGAGSMIMDRYVLTAAHVVAGADSIVVQAASPSYSQPRVARLLAIDPVHDLAMLGIDGPPLPPLDIGTAEVGDQGVAVVFRDGRAVERAFTIAKEVDVRILDIYHVSKVSRPGYVVDIDIAAGDSGALMVASDGKAVGVLYAVSRNTDQRAFATDLATVDTLALAAAHADQARGIATGECI